MAALSSPVRVVEVLARIGGVAPTRMLVAGGLHEKEVQRAAASGVIDRITRGWYALPDADREAVSAVRAGASLGCISGAAHHGLWRPPRTGLHLSVPHGSSGPRPYAGGDPVVVHWGGPAGAHRGPAVLPLLACLIQVLSCQPVDHAFAVLESALHRRRVPPADMRSLRRSVGRVALPLVDLAHSLSESGTESLFRYRMHVLGVTMQSQVEVGGVGRVDFVIGDRLIIEIDSEAHHGGAEQRRRDLARDAIAVGLGFVVLRFDYRQVLSDWETVESTVLAVIGRGEHLRRP